MNFQIQQALFKQPDNVPSNLPEEHSEVAPAVMQSEVQPSPYICQSFDEDMVEPDDAFKELRLNHPRTFTSLIASYLTYIEFEFDDIYKIADEVSKQEALLANRRKSDTSSSLSSSRFMPGSPISRSVFTPVKMNGFLSGWSANKVSRGKRPLS